MSLTLDEIINGLTIARDAANAVPGSTPVEVWIDGSADQTVFIQDIISDVNGVSILLEER